jgi:iron complex transport system permease protein
MAFLAGGALAVAGYISQLLLNNPLADPYVLGVSGGAGVTVNLALFLGLPMFSLGFFMPYFYAFIGAAGVAFLLFYQLKNKTSNLTSILLLGLAINFFASACVSLMIFLSKDSLMIRDISFWFMGSYSKVSFIDFLFVSIAILVLMVFTQLNYAKLHQLHLGIRRIQELGIDTHKIFSMGVLLLVLFTTLVVTACGPIGFVGLLVPHYVRTLDLQPKILFPACFLMGGVLTLGSELISSALFSQSLPPGVVTAMFGVPVFLYLLTKKYRFHL